MFEPIEPEGRYAAKRLATLAISVVLHALIIGLIVVVPLIFFNVLPNPEILTFLATPPLPPPPPPPPAPPAAAEYHAPKVTVSETKYVAPRVIPKGIHPPQPQLNPQTAENVLASVYDGVPGGVIGGVPGGVPGGVVGGVLGSTGPPQGLAPPPPPPKPTPKVIRVGGALQASKLVYKVDPTYPVLAKQARISGMVLLQVTVDGQGDVSNVKVLRGHPLLVPAAVNAVKQWKYSPTILNGQAVSVIADVTVFFQLQGSST